MSQQEQELELLRQIADDVWAIHFLLHLLTKTDPYDCKCVEARKP